MSKVSILRYKNNDPKMGLIFIRQSLKYRDLMSNNKRPEFEPSDFIPFIQNFVALKRSAHVYVNTVYNDVFKERAVSEMLKDIQYSKNGDIQLVFPEYEKLNEYPATAEVLDAIIVKSSGRFIRNGKNYNIGVRSKVDGKIKTMASFIKQVEKILQEKKIEKLQEKFNKLR